MDVQTRFVPEHVPQHLVYDYEVYSGPRNYEYPQVELSEKLAREAPPIFWSPLNGGHWVITRAADAQAIMRNSEVFSSDPKYNKDKAMVPVRHLPLYYDPPEHGEARKILAPLFTPTAVLKMEQGIRSLAQELIEAVYAKGECEFVSEIGHRYPVTIFMRLADGPMDAREELIEKAGTYLRSEDFATRQKSIRELTDYLTKFVDERSNKLGDDLISLIVKATFLGRPLTREEIIGGTVLMFLAGLDTVASMTSFVMHFLARHPEQYAELVRNPELIPNAVEELMRVCAVSAPERGVRTDTVYNGIEMRQGDRVVIMLQFSGMDKGENKNPAHVDFTREVSFHLAFGSGPHRCMGSHLARLEIRTLLQEWTKRIPEMRFKEGADVHVQGGQVWVPASMPLVWTPAA